MIKDKHKAVLPLYDPPESCGWRLRCHLLWWPSPDQPLKRWGRGGWWDWGRESCLHWRCILGQGHTEPKDQETHNLDLYHLACKQHLVFSEVKLNGLIKLVNENKQTASLISNKTKWQKKAESMSYYSELGIEVIYWTNRTYILL